MKRKFNTTIAFTDMLFNVLMGFFLLLMLALMVVNPKSKSDGESPVKPKSQIMIEIEWPDTSKSDVDLFLQVPNKRVVFYNNREVPGAQLNRDDMGTVNDKITMPDGSVKVINENWEHILITKLVPGWYTVNVVLYSNKDRAPVPIAIKVQQFKPYKVLLRNNFKLKRRLEETTQIRFRVDKKGNIVQKSDVFKRLIKKKGRR